MRKTKRNEGEKEKRKKAGIVGFIVVASQCWKKGLAIVKGVYIMCV